jgi:hypothetical protein
MICPHCKVASHEDWNLVAEGPLIIEGGQGIGIEYMICPECKKPIIKWFSASAIDDEFDTDDDGEYIISDSRIVYPLSNETGLSYDIPDKYKEDFFEALSLVSQSPKASAALSRRLLQTLLMEEGKIKDESLSKQIEKFCSRQDIPPILSESVHAIRAVGNFAAHPMKDKNTGEIVQVEPGEAEWSLDVLRGLFDYFFIQPALFKRRKDDLNNKLKALGKPLLK